MGTGDSRIPDYTESPGTIGNRVVRSEENDMLGVREGHRWTFRAIQSGDAFADPIGGDYIEYVTKVQ